MHSPATQFVSSSRIAVYEPIHEMSLWGDFKGNGCPNASAIIEFGTKPDSQSEDTSHVTLGIPNDYDQEPPKPVEKVLKRLAQNREAARKSRLRKKAYVQQLETSRLKLHQLEQELQSVSPQGAHIGGGVDAGHLGYSATVNSGITAFEMDYGQWVEEQNRQILKLRNALQSHLADIELRVLVDGGMNHYFDLFRMKATAAKVDVFYLMTGMWRTSAERLFQWIGGFRPSDLLSVLVPQLDLLDEQLSDVYNLKQSCQQAEDALSQGMEKLQQLLAENVSAGQLGEGSYIPQVASAMENLEALVCFVNQADHLRKEALQQMSQILTARQAARGLLALGEYFQSLRALSLLWATRPHEPA